jgi:hypothetical protein
MRTAALFLLAAGTLTFAGQPAHADEQADAAAPASTGAVRVSLGSGMEGAAPTMVVRADLDQRWRGARGQPARARARRAAAAATGRRGDLRLGSAA